MPPRAFALAIAISGLSASLARADEALGTGEWIDTGANNSLVEDDRLFESLREGGEEVFVTRSTLTNIHSHAVLSAPLAVEELTGEMRIDDARGGVGVTFRSRYPWTDQYYRLRRYSKYEFEIEPHGTRVAGDTKSGVIPKPGVWYRFRVRVSDDGGRTTIRARIWAENESEPSSWQIDCYDSSAARMKDGTLGCWSMGPGRKTWRRLVADGKPVPFSPEGFADMARKVTVPPSIEIVSAEDKPTALGMKVSFMAQVTDPDSDIAPNDVKWSFGDGETAEGLTATHLYTTNGSYRVVAKVRDEAGNEGSDEVEVQVLGETAPAPSAVRWVDTRAQNSLVEDDSLFVNDTVDGVPVLLTMSKDTNIHSHLEGDVEWGTMDFRGRFRNDHERGGVGVTFLSDYPRSDRYYRLRRYYDLPFHIDPHGTKVKGDTDTGVVPLPGVWYEFAVEVTVGASDTRIRAKVWKSGSAEPGSWQVDCRDASATRLKTGTIGCWSMGAGAKYWSSFRVNGAAVPFTGSLDAAPSAPAPTLVEHHGFDDPASLSLGSGPYSLVVDSSKAYAGAGALRVDLGNTTPTRSLFPGPFLDVIAPFWSADSVFASARVRLEAPASFKLSSLVQAIDELLAAKPDALSAEEAAIARKALGELESGARSLPSFEANRWYCLGVAYLFPTPAGDPGRFVLFVDGVPAVVLEGVKLPDHGGLLSTLVALLRHRALVTSSKVLWLDELSVSTMPTACR